MLKHSYILSSVLFAALILIGLSNYCGLDLTSEVSTLDDIAFVLVGVCGLLDLKKSKHASDLMASLITCIGLYSLYLLRQPEVNLDLNSIFGVGSPTPVFCLVMIAYGLATLISRRSKQKYFWLGTFGSLAVSIGFVGLIDSVFEVKSIYKLIETNRVSISTAFCFLAMGTTLVLAALRQGGQFRSYWVHWAMWIFGITLTLYTTQAIRSHDVMQLNNLAMTQSYRNDVIVLVFGIVATTSLAVFFRLSVQESTFQRKIFYDYVPVVIVFISLLFATCMYFFLHSNFRTNTHKKFYSDFKSQTIRLTQGLQKYNEVLYTIKDVFDVSKIVERDEFELVSQRNIDRLPGLYGLGWIQELSNFDQAKFEKSISKEINRPFYLFHLQASENKKRVFVRNNAYPILYMVPSLENQSFLGLEMLGYKSFRDEVQNVDSNGVLTITNKFAFLKNKELKQGLLSLLKVDKSNKLIDPTNLTRSSQNGYIFSLLNLEQAIESILFTFDNELGINLQFQEIDDSTTASSKVFSYEPSTSYLSHTWGGFTVTIDNSLERSVEIDFSDTKWLVTGTPSNSVNYPNWKASNLFLPIGIFILGCFVALISKKRNNDIRSLKSLQKDLEASMVEAQQSSQSKSDFLANMSHEIRTPMNGIIGMSHLALQTKLSPKQRNYISKVYDSGQSLLEIINDILDFSKIEAGKLDVEKVSFSLEKVIQNFISLVGLRSEEKELDLIIDIDQDVPFNLIGDPLRIGQVLVNLGVNAAKFTDVGEIILRVSVKASEKDKLTLLFSVKDTGIGMSKKQVSRLFKPFTQADASTTRKFGGTGLGLVISKRLCNLMNGEIWVESEEDKGSTFSFTIDLEVNKKENSEKIEVSQSMIDGKTLIVTAKKGLSKVLYSNLAYQGIEVVVVDTIKKALETLQDSTKPPAFTHMLIDWQTPDGCAIELIQKLAKDVRYSTLKPMLITTVYSKPKLFELAHDLHFDVDATIVSPMTPNSLFADMSKCLSHHSDPITTPSQLADFDEATLNRLSGAKLLLVEDNKVNQFLAIALLKKANLLVTVVDNGKQAIEKLDQEEFDGVLMDIQMPVMDGYTATKIIRQNEAYKDLPVIAMTANVMKSDIEKIYAVGMNNYIAKPLDIKGMYLTIAKYINKGKDINPIN